MSQYNQLEVIDGITVEVTDQSVYFSPVGMNVATALYYEGIEDVYEHYTNGDWDSVVDIGHSLSLDVTDEYIHIINHGFTTSIPHDEFEQVYEFYQDIKPELRDENRKVVFAVNEEGIVSESEYTSDEYVEDVVLDFQSRYDYSYDIVIESATNFQGP